MFNPKEFEKFAEENQESIKEVRKKLKKENDRNKPLFLEKVEKEFFSGNHTEEDISKFNKLMRKIKKDI